MPADLVARRRQIVAMIEAESQRRRKAPPRVAKSIERLLNALERKLASLNQDIDDGIKGSPGWREKEDFLRSDPVSGSAIARTVIAELPELGTLD